jgi:hypothetical protein
LHRSKNFGDARKPRRLKTDFELDQAVVEYSNIPIMGMLLPRHRSNYC